MQKDVITADLRTTEGIRDAEAFFVRLLGDAVKPSKDGETPLKLVGAASGIKHQVETACCLAPARMEQPPWNAFPSRGKQKLPESDTRGCVRPVVWECRRDIGFAAATLGELGIGARV